MISITLLNITVIVLIYGARAARKGKYKSNHKLVYNHVTFPVFVFLSTLLWFSAAVSSYGIMVNVNFCGEYPNHSLLGLLEEGGFGNSSFYYYTQRYVEVSYWLVKKYRNILKFVLELFIFFSHHFHLFPFLIGMYKWRRVWSKFEHFELKPRRRYFRCERAPDANVPRKCMCSVFFAIGRDRHF